jgi:hypothetical protein
MISNITCVWVAMVYPHNARSDNTCHLLAAINSVNELLHNTNVVVVALIILLLLQMVKLKTLKSTDV